MHNIQTITAQKVLESFQVILKDLPGDSIVRGIHLFDIEIGEFVDILDAEAEDLDKQDCPAAAELHRVFAKLLRQI